MNTTASPPKSTTLRHTPLGTPCSKLWDEPWIEKVHAIEMALNRRVCGARTQAGTVCTLESDHSSGRCRFHGGFDLTGAPKGNRNAVVHGLYSRRLMVCGEHCPMWHSCPCAGEDIAKLEPRERPTCPYEQTEYNAAVTDGLSLVERRADPNPLDRQAVHILALLQVMMSRIARTLSTHRMTQMIVSANCQRHDERMHPAFAAMTRLMWEYRHIRRMLPGDEFAPATPESVAKQVLRMAADTDLTPDAQETMHFPDDPVESAAAGLIERAEAEANAENAERAFALYEASRAFMPDEDGARLARVQRVYRSGKRAISKELRDRYLKNVSCGNVADLKFFEGYQAGVKEWQRWREFLFEHIEEETGDCGGGSEMNQPQKRAKGAQNAPLPP